MAQHLNYKSNTYTSIVIAVQLLEAERLYTKYVQIYLQQMASQNCLLNAQIRRSDKAWSGVWSDTIIEQTLNRFFGTDLKYGRGVTSIEQVI